MNEKEKIIKDSGDEYGQNDLKIQKILMKMLEKPVQKSFIKIILIR